MMAIPKAMLEGLGLAANVKVSLSLDHGRLVVEPQPKPRYTLAELLAQCDPAAPEDPEERLWDNLPPVGSEIF